MPDKNRQTIKITIKVKRKLRGHNSQAKEFRRGRDMHTKLKNKEKNYYISRG
jgi:hypothetical protein